MRLNQRWCHQHRDDQRKKVYCVIMQKGYRRRDATIDGARSAQSVNGTLHVDGPLKPHVTSNLSSRDTWLVSRLAKSLERSII